MASNVNPQKLDELMALAAKKMGITQEELREKLKGGSLEKEAQKLSGMPGVAQILKDPQRLEALLNTPEAQRILKDLAGKK